MAADIKISSWIPTQSETAEMQNLVQDIRMFLDIDGEAGPVVLDIGGGLTYVREKRVDVADSVKSVVTSKTVPAMVPFAAVNPTTSPWKVTGL